MGVMMYYAKEKQRIMQFALDHLVVTDRVRGTPMRDVFERYKRWVKQTDKEEVTMSIDSFGRMFPKSFTRKYLSFNGEVLSCIVGVALD